jgi:hypothetical protein
MENVDQEQQELLSPKEYLLAVPVPEMTWSYKPVSHGDLIRVTLESIEACGFELVKEIYTYRKEGQVANGKYLLKYGDDPDMSLMIAWQNSYDKSLSLKFAVGTWVYICTNGCVSGNMGAFRSKHIGDVQTVSPAVLREYICKAGEQFNTMVAQKEAMKLVQITSKQRAEVLGVLFIDRKLITSTQLNAVKNSIEKPQYDYGCPGSVWELYNYVTESMREISPQYWLSAQVNLHQWFIQEYNIEA